MWDKTVPSVTFRQSPRSRLYVEEFSKISLFSPRLSKWHSSGTALVAWSYPYKNLYKIFIFCCITVTFEVGLRKTSGCSPIVFFSPQLYAKVTFKSHTWEERLGSHRNPSLSLYSSSYYSVTLALTEILTVVGENSELSLSKQTSTSPLLQVVQEQFSTYFGYAFFRSFRQKLPDCSGVKALKPSV